MSADETQKLSRCVIFATFAGVVGFWFASVWLPAWWAGSQENAGQFGDQFGAVNALFSGLAFAGLIVTLLLQRHELKLQREEMQQMREQYERSALAQEGSEKLLRQQTRATLIAAQLDGAQALLAHASHLATAPGLGASQQTITKLATHPVIAEINELAEEAEKLKQELGQRIDDRLNNTE